MEKYGKKPKKFTVEWYEYIWEYYKLHIIVAVLLVAAVVYTWVSIASAPRYDLDICFSLSRNFGDEAKNKLMEELAANVDDIDGNGEVDVNFLDCSVPDGFDDAEYASSMDSKFYLELQVGDSYIFVVSKDMAERLTKDSALDGLFEKASEWSGAEGDFEYFADAGKSKFFRNAGIPADGVYIGIRNFAAGEGSDKDLLKRQNAVLAAEIILGNV